MYLNIDQKAYQETAQESFHIAVYSWFQSLSRSRGGPVFVSLSLSLSLSCFYMFVKKRHSKISAAQSDMNHG